MFENQDLTDLYQSEINRNFDKPNVGFYITQLQYNGFNYDE